MNNKLKKIKPKYIAVINYFDGMTNIVQVKSRNIMDICGVVQYDKYVFEVLLYEKRRDGKYEMINWVHKELDSEDVDRMLKYYDDYKTLGGNDQMLKHYMR